MNLALLLATFSLSCLFCTDQKPRIPRFLDHDDLFTRSFLVGIGYNLANIPEFVKALDSTGRDCPRLFNELEELEILKFRGAPGLKVPKEDIIDDVREIVAGEDIIVGDYSFFRTMVLFCYKLKYEENDVQQSNIMKIMQETFAVTPELNSLVQACGYEQFDLPFLNFLAELNMDDDDSDLYQVADNLIGMNANSVSFDLLFIMFKGSRPVQEEEVMPIFYCAQHLFSDTTGRIILRRLEKPLSTIGLHNALQSGASDAFIMEALDRNSRPNNECLLLALTNKRSSDLVKALIRKTLSVSLGCLAAALDGEYGEDVIQLMQ